jgi:hypothetical protein
MHFGSISYGGPVPYHVSSVVPRIRAHVSLRLRNDMVQRSFKIGMTTSFSHCWFGLLDVSRGWSKFGIAACTGSEDCLLGDIDMNGVG